MYSIIHRGKYKLLNTLHNYPLRMHCEEHKSAPVSQLTLIDDFAPLYLYIQFVSENSLTKFSVVENSI